MHLHRDFKTMLSKAMKIFDVSIDKENNVV